MNKSPLDLSKFHKIKSDEHSSTFEHEKGHRLTVAHSRLSKSMRESLEKLPTRKGSGAKDEPVQKFAYGSPSVQPIQNSSPLAPSPDDPEFLQAMGAAPPSGIPAASEVTSSPAMIPEAAPPPVADPSAGLAQVASPMASASPEASTGLPDPFSAMNKEQTGLQIQAMAQGNLGSAQARQEQQFQTKADAQLAAYTQDAAERQAKRDALQEDIANSHVDPERYVNNMSTGGKITSAIGLILGGMGAGLTNGPNLAFQYLQKQIDNDIDSQKGEIGKKQNLLSQSIQEEGSFRAGYDQARVNTNDILASRLRQEAAKAQNPMAQGTLLELAGKFEAKSAELVQKMAMQKAMAADLPAGANQDAAFKNKVMALKMAGKDSEAKDLEARYVPGMGVATTADGAKVVREMNSMANNARAGIDELLAINRQDGKSLNPQTIARAKVIQQSLIGALRVPITGPGAMTEGERDMLQDMIANPTDFFALDSNNKTKLETLRGRLDSAVKTAAQANGLSSGSSEEIKYKDGIPYKKVPGGWERAK